MAEVTLNQNIAHCIRSTNDLGRTTVRNICSGTESIVPWGSLDWIVFVGVSAVVLGCFLMFASMAISMWRGW